MLIVSNFLLWVVVLLQLVAIAALARRLKLLPGPQRGAGGGLHLVHDAQPGSAEQMVAEEAATGATMLLHVSAGCPVGQRLLPDADLMARTAGLRFMLVRSGATGRGAASPFAQASRGRRGGATGEQLPAPYLMILDAAGDVIVQGGVKSRPELTRLLARATQDRPGSAVAGV